MAIMRTAFLPAFLKTLLPIALLLGLLFLPVTPAHAESHVMMQNAMDLIHKAWNPGGKTPSNAKRMQYLTQAMQFLQDDPYRGNGTGYNRERIKAMRYVRSAMLEIQQGDPYKLVWDYLQDAEDACRSALSDG
jgi:hypothetical protein